MIDYILSGRIEIPSVSPQSRAHNRFFSKEDKQQVRIVGYLRTTSILLNEILLYIIDRKRNGVYVNIYSILRCECGWMFTNWDYIIWVFIIVLPLELLWRTRKQIRKPKSKMEWENGWTRIAWVVSLVIYNIMITSRVRTAASIIIIM